MTVSFCLLEQLYLPNSTGIYSDIQSFHLQMNVLYSQLV